jgi:hypothetical protein
MQLSLKRGTAVCYDIRRELVMPGEFQLLAAAVNAYCRM